MTSVSEKNVKKSASLNKIKFPNPSAREIQKFEKNENLIKHNNETPRLLTDSFRNINTLSSAARPGSLEITSYYRLNN